MIQKITHRYLREELLSFTLTEDIDDLLVELQYSNLIAPKLFTKGFSTVTYGDNNFIPLFTDMGEYGNPDDYADAFPMAHDFHFYLKYLQKGSFVGFILNPHSEKFFIGSEFLELIEPVDEELQREKNSHQISEAELNKLLKCNAYTDLYELVNRLSESSVFTLLNPDNPDDFDSSLYVHESIWEKHALVFTSDSEISFKNNLIRKKADLSSVMEYILRYDLDGIILNIDSDNIRISRSVIRTFMKDFNCQFVKGYSHYAYVIE